MSHLDVHSKRALAHGPVTYLLSTLGILGVGLVCLAGCAGGLSASGGMKLDAKTGLTTSLDTKLSTKAEVKAAEEKKAAAELGAALDTVLAGSQRSDANKARDKYQHPRETLEFFGLKTDMTVLEVEPGSDGWYTEIFAPLLKDDGKYIATNFDPNGPAKSPLTADAKEYQAKLDGNPDAYGKVQVVTLTKDYNLGEADSVDMVVTFRNSHLWKTDKLEDRVYGEMFRVLKPGGVLGLVQHRAAAGDNPAKTVSKGYLPQPYVIERVEKAGFVFEAESHVNTNSWDTRDYPKGVWTLPPSLAMKDKDREKYLKIGESDRMTLRFRKPLNTPGSEKTEEAPPATDGKAEEAKGEPKDADTSKAGATTDSKAPDAKAPDAKTPVAKPSDAKPSEPKPSEPKPSDAKPSEPKPSDAKSEPKAAGAKVEAAAAPAPSDAHATAPAPVTPNAGAGADKAPADKAPTASKPAADKKAAAVKPPEKPAAAHPAAPPKPPEVRPVPTP